MTFDQGTRPRPLGDVPAVLAGFAAAVAGAFLWGLIVYSIKHQFSIAAILMGVLVGMAIGAFRPRTMAAPVAGAILAVFGCAFGDFLALIFVAVGRAGLPLGYVLGHLSVLLHAYPHTVGALGFVFWAIAAFVGFRITMTRMQRPGATPPPAPGYAQPGYGTQPGYGAQPGYGTQPGYGEPGYEGPGFAVPRNEPPRNQPPRDQQPPDEPPRG
jgi:hypothetical protein